MAGGETFSEGSRDIHVTDIDCSGTETAWNKCPFNISASDCGPFEDAYAACQGTCMPALLQFPVLVLACI